jgi:hypothetical protein
MGPNWPLLASDSQTTSGEDWEHRAPVMSDEPRSLSRKLSACASNGARNAITNDNFAFILIQRTSLLHGGEFASLPCTPMFDGFLPLFATKSHVTNNPMAAPAMALPSR